MRHNFGARFLIRNVLLFILILITGGLSGCSVFSASTDDISTSTVTPAILPTTNPTSTRTSAPLPSATTTHLPRPTRTPRPSPTHKPSPTPLPQPFVIGDSLAERPLEVYHFGEGPRNLLIVAGIHGGYEWNTIALADELITHLTSNPSIIPNGITLYILRSANPDGEAREFGSAGRANENGVDINRNFPANWVAEWNRTGCWNHQPITAGTRPSSEPEAAAIIQFVLSNQIKAMINYHSAALGIFAGGQPPDADSIELAQTLVAISPYRYPPPYNTGCEYTGQLTDWAVLHNIPAVDVELTNHYDTDFQINLRILEAFLVWGDEK